MMDVVSYRRGFWFSLLFRAGTGSISFGAGRWEVLENDERTLVDQRAVDDVVIQRGLFWSTLCLLANGRSYEFRGLAHGAANHLRGLQLVAPLPAMIMEALAAWQRIVDRKLWVNHGTWSAWKTHYQQTRAVAASAEVHWLPESEQDRIRQFREALDKIEESVASINRAHVQRELQACGALFDRIESSPLTTAQRVAVVTDEDNTLVVAGAGTGKTSVVVAKVAYLVGPCGVRPSEILLLSYNRKAAEEIEERIAAQVGSQIKVATFHALGLAIIGEATGIKPTVSRLAAESDATVQFVDGVVRAMLRDAVWCEVLIPYLVEHLKPCRGQEEFTNQHAYIAYIKGTPIRTMCGEQVKSHEEQTIANWLYVNGIEYEYERPYEYNVADANHSQYRPDFHLPEYCVYIEHFGIDRNQNTAPWVPRERYIEGILWKRGTHARCGTRLVETFSYDRMEGALTRRLEERLALHGIKPRRRPVEELEKTADDSGAMLMLSRLLTSFLLHFKEGRCELDALRATDRGSTSRARQFLRVFEHVFNEYERALQAERAIDFTDMIKMATEIVISGRYRSQYTRVIVDEFQDLSRGRAGLLKALLNQLPDRRFVAVGDDWQSIYRFAGSDIAHMTKFAEHFGYAAITHLDRTFRFGQRLVDASARFVQENPAQLRKSIRSTTMEPDPPIVIIPSSKTIARDREASRQARAEEIRETLRRIERDRPAGPPTKVYLLGRYNHSLPVANVADLVNDLHHIDVEFHTVHRSKGLQADYVVVLDAISGRYGFPSQIADDPLMSLVLATPDEYEHAEERRLFYVALTRAKRRVFVLTRETQRSAFVDEMLGEDYRDLVAVEGDLGRGVLCPACGGWMVRRTREKDANSFWGCTDFPYCRGAANVCSVCQRGAMIRDGAVFRCSERGCSGNVDACPRCGEGILVEHRNRNSGGMFLGCSRWRSDGAGCPYTRNIKGVHFGR